MAANILLSNINPDELGASLEHQTLQKGYTKPGTMSFEFALPLLHALLRLKPEVFMLVSRGIRNSHHGSHELLS